MKDKTAKKSQTKTPLTPYEKCIKILKYIGYLIIFIAAFNIFLEGKDYYQSQKLYHRTNHQFVTNKTETKTSVTNGNEQKQDTRADGIDVDFEKLQQENSDIVGWIYFENEDISYPILYSGDNEEYLRKAYTGEIISAGSIFLDGNNQPDFQDKHILIYGHNMRDLSMFGKLKFYKTKEDYYEAHQYFQIITKEDTARYRVFAYKDVKSVDGIYKIIDKTGEGLEDFITNNCLKHSYLSEEIWEESKQDLMKNNPEDYKNELQVVTLSTCTREDNRFVVCGVKVDQR